MQKFDALQKINIKSVIHITSMHGKKTIWQHLKYVIHKKHLFTIIKECKTFYAKTVQKNMNAKLDI